MGLRFWGREGDGSRPVRGLYLKQLLHQYSPPIAAPPSFLALIHLSRSTQTCACKFSSAGAAMPLGHALHLAEGEQSWRLPPGKGSFVSFPQDFTATGKLDRIGPLV